MILPAENAELDAAGLAAAFGSTNTQMKADDASMRVRIVRSC